MTHVTDSEGTILRYTYTPSGHPSTVTDGQNHTVTYSYDSYDRLTKTATANNEYTHYFFDSHGRATKVGAGASGNTDPVVYGFDSSTGALSSVSYVNGALTRSSRRSAQGTLFFSGA
jgi:YD repeat-containing protein